MSEIVVSRLTKEFRLGTLTNFKDSVTNLYRRLANEELVKRSSFKALDDISFSVDPGEVVGIIGHNGAGKSTLLKILSRIVTPTSGAITVRGKVAPLIEVGAGLIGDLTGRENIYLNAAILGMKKKEVDRKFDEIVEFAELENFIDTPIKRYSSGMQVRIGFAIATSVEADTLIVDEVLAVGDLAFQRKCFDRVEDIIKRRGNTVLLVSHNIRQVIRLCTRVLLLDQGRILKDGKPSEIAELFYERSNRKIQEARTHNPRITNKIDYSGEIDVLDIQICDSRGVSTQEILSGDTLRVRIKLRSNVRMEKPEVIVGTHTTDFVYLTSGSTALFEDRPDFDIGEHDIEYVVQSFPLVAGTYCIRLVILNCSGRVVVSGETLAMFHVQPLLGESKQPRLRNLHIPARWRIDAQYFSEQPISNQLTNTKQSESSS